MVRVVTPELSHRVPDYTAARLCPATRARPHNRQQSLTPQTEASNARTAEKRANAERRAIAEKRAIAHEAARRDEWQPPGQLPAHCWTLSSRQAASSLLDSQLTASGKLTAAREHREHRKK